MKVNPPLVTWKRHLEENEEHLYEALPAPVMNLEDGFHTPRDSDANGHEEHKVLEHAGIQEQ